MQQLKLLMIITSVFVILLFDFQQPGKLFQFTDISAKLSISFLAAAAVAVALPSRKSCSRTVQRIAPVTVPNLKLIFFFFLFVFLEDKHCITII